jgi:hypothetical protein
MISFPWWASAALNLVVKFAMSFVQQSQLNQANRD